MKKRKKFVKLAHIGLPILFTTIICCLVFFGYQLITHKNHKTFLEKLEIGTKYPNDYLDFKEFAIKNNKVNHFEDLKCGWKEKLLLDFSDKNNLKIVMETLFSKVDIGDTFYELSNEEKIQKILKEYNSTYRIIYKNINLYQLYEKIEEEESC